MKIGVKYCGGCNSRYDRTKQVAKLIQQFPTHTFTYQPGQEVCDICLLVCGCMTACATPEGIAAKRFVQLCTPAQFSKFAAQLQEENTSSPEQSKRILRVGQHASLCKTFTDADIQAFAALTGDYGRQHTDPAFAAQYGFGRPVVHGVLTGSLLSAVMGTKLPGDGTILADESLQFIAPVYAGDTITATVTLKKITESKRWFIGELHGVCINQDGTVVAEGIYHQVMIKTLFAYDSENSAEKE